MPNRIVREGILTSEAVNSLGAVEEVFYRRLISVVDDFGRYYAHSSLLRAALYPLKLDKVSDWDIGKWLLVTEKAGLVRVYPASDGKRYLEVQRFGQHVRAKESKFPQPDARMPDKRAASANTCNADAVQMQRERTASAPVFVFGDGDEGSAEPQRDSPPHAPPVASLPLNDGTEFPIDELQVEKWTETYPAVDVPQQLREMRAWCEANPSQRKTRRGINAFVVRWLGKEQDRGGGKRLNGSPVASGDWTMEAL